MPTTLPTVAPVDPAEHVVLVKVHPAHLSHDALEVLHAIADRKSDPLRDWLKSRVREELGRRAVDEDGETECAGWSFNWHKLNDEELAESLMVIASLVPGHFGDEANAVLGAIQTVIVGCVAARLGELHQAIENARARQ